MRDRCASKPGTLLILCACMGAGLFIEAASADESGASFWQPGQYGSFAATQTNPGWSFESTFFHATASASTGVEFPRGRGIQLGMKSPSDYVMATPTYTFATPVLGGQASVGMTGLFGRNTTSVSATLNRPGEASISGSRSDYLVDVGDLYPTASLKWNRDVHNVMIYASAGVPVGAYNPTRLATMGLAHWATDAGAGYTYYNEQARFEWSAVVGLTYNFINPYTQYQSGTDAHLDWAISHYVDDKLYIGAVGYVFNQLTGDSGAGARLGEFKSRVAGVGPQIGFFFPVADRQGSLNLRAYHEFDARNRLAGWTGFVTFSIEAPEEKAPKIVRKR